MQRATARYPYVGPRRSPDPGSTYAGGSRDPGPAHFSGPGHFPDPGPGRSPDPGSTHAGGSLDPGSIHAGGSRDPRHFLDPGSARSLDSSAADWSLSVSEEELRSELSLLGFPDVPRHRLLQFKEELELLMRSRPASANHSGDSAQSEKENRSASSLLDSSSDKHSDWPMNVSNGEPSQRPLYARHATNLCGQGRAPVVTRKVLRKKSNGQVEVCDESTLSSGTCEDGSLSITDQSLEGFSRQSSLSVDRVKSFIRVPPYSLLEQYRQHSDPVSRYHDYKQSWDCGQRVLERNRKELRWGVRERMMSAPPAPLPRSLPAPNTYIIPTDKKRSGLRWAIRQHLVNGHMPPPLSS